MTMPNGYFEEWGVLAAKDITKSTALCMGDYLLRGGVILASRNSETRYRHYYLLRDKVQTGPTTNKAGPILSMHSIFKFVS